MQRFQEMMPAMAAVFLLSGVSRAADLDTVMMGRAAFDQQQPVDTSGG